MNRDPKTNHQPDHDEDLRQTLLELHYGLLEDDEAVALKRRIETEPKVASLWANTLVVAGKFAEAAKIGDSTEQSKSSFEGGASESSTPATHDTHRSTATAPAASGDSPAADAHSTGPSSDSGSSRFLPLGLGSLATAATIAIALCGIRYWGQLPPSPEADLRVSVRPVAGANSKARNEFLVAVGPRSEQQSGNDSFDASMPFVPATISFQVLSKGATLFLGTAESSASGPCRISVPDRVAIPGDAVLHVDASPVGRDDQMIRLTVPLEPTRCLTFLSTDRPVYRPGETLFYRSVTLNRRTLASHLDVPIRYELADASGAAVQGALIEGVTERGVGNGAFIIPESAPGGTYQLMAKS